MSLMDLLKQLNNDQLRDLWLALGLEPDDLPERKSDRAYVIATSSNRQIDLLFAHLHKHFPNLRPFFPLIIVQSCRRAWANNPMGDVYPLKELCMGLGDVPCDKLLLADLGFSTWTNEDRYLREQAEALQKYMEENGRFDDLLNAIAKQSPRLDLTAFRAGSVTTESRATITPAARQEIVYHNFDVHVRGKNANGRYPIEVGDNPLGRYVSVEQTINPAATYLATLISNITSSSTHTANEEDVRELGKYLRELILPDRVNSILHSNMDEVARNGERLRIRLQIKPPELQKLPWEYCYDDDFGYYALRLDTPVVRYTNRPFRSQALPVPTPLKVLVVVSEPSDQAPLNVEKEVRLIDKILGVLGDNVQVEVLRNAEIGRVQHALRRNPHIFHFIGHGSQQGDKPGSLLFTKSNGRSHAVTGEQLMVLMRGRGIKTVILNACQTASSGTQNAFGSVATALIHGDIPAVIAMKFSVRDDVAIGFTRDLYSSLAAGRPLDAAITEMRIGAHMLGESHWGIPTLYMQSPDGKLWQYDEQLEQKFRRAIDGEWVN